MKMTYTLAALAASALAANAAILTYGSTAEVGGTGNYGGQTFTASDISTIVPAYTGFTETGDALTPSFALESIEIAKWSGAGNAIYANIYDGATFLGSSTNVVDWSINLDGIIGDDAGDAWLFDGVTNLQNLDSSKVYSIRFSTTNTAGDFTDVRPGIIDDSSQLTGGNLITTGGAEVASGWDAHMVITTTIVPEPSSAALLGLGGLALILRRRK